MLKPVLSEVVGNGEPTTTKSETIDNRKIRLMSKCSCILVKTTMYRSFNSSRIGIKSTS